MMWPDRGAEEARLERMPEPYRAALRRALLQRVADRLALAGLLNDEQNDPDAPGRELAACCWVAYDVRRRAWDGRWVTERWVHRLCAEDCPHWHHHTEVWLAMAAPTD